MPKKYDLKFDPKSGIQIRIENPKSASGDKLRIRVLGKKYEHQNRPPGRRSRSRAGR